MQSQRIPGQPKGISAAHAAGEGKEGGSVGVGVLLSQVRVWDLAQCCVKTPVEHTQVYEAAVFIELWKTVLTVQLSKS